MYIDPITVSYPEALDKDHFVIATYYCATKPSTNSLKFAAALAIEQTCGTWLKVPGETEEVRISMKTFQSLFLLYTYQ